MHILIIGSGGREHAIAWKIAQSKLATRVFVAPGNAGTSLEPKVCNVPIEATDRQGLLSFASEQTVDLTIVGPEAPLVDGIVDAFQSAGLKIFGPTQSAAQLEGSKAFSKDFLKRHNIPTAAYQSFEDEASARNYLQGKTPPFVIKADGLAAGKGVIIAETLADAEAAVANMLSGNQFGKAGHRVVIEDFLQGEEVSFIVMVSGDTIIPMASSQDHKRIGEGDTGLNTGGMGAYSPAPIVDQRLHDNIMREVIEPTVAGMRDEGAPYQGFLYAGLMIDEQKQPFVIEFNCRLGDPETQPLMMRLNSDLLALCLASVEGRLGEMTSEWSEQHAIGVVLSADGYPEAYRKGDEVSGLPPETEKTKVFHAGTALVEEQVVTNGGRVLCVTALGDDLQQAAETAYHHAANIHWPGRYYRRDIGHRALKRS